MAASLSQVQHSSETQGFGASGAAMLVVTLALFLAAGALVFVGMFVAPLALVGGVLIGLLALLFLRGFFVLQPNESEVITQATTRARSARTAGTGRTRSRRARA